MALLPTIPLPVSAQRRAVVADAEAVVVGMAEFVHMGREIEGFVLSELLGDSETIEKIYRSAPVSATRLKMVI